MAYLGQVQTNPTAIERPADLTADWLTETIGAGRVADFTVERIGTGQMSECYRIGLTYAGGDDGPKSVVLKVAATDPMSRQTGLALGLYEREVRFYSDVAPGLGGPIAGCYHASYDPETGVFALLLDDAAPAAVGDEIRGATLAEARLALQELGRLHGPLMGRDTFSDAEWLHRDAPVNQALIAGLFAATQCPGLDAARLENRALLGAIFRLAWLRESGGLVRVNWREACDS